MCAAPAVASRVAMASSPRMSSAGVWWLSRYSPITGCVGSRSSPSIAELHSTVSSSCVAKRTRWRVMTSWTWASDSASTAVAVSTS